MNLKYQDTTVFSGGGSVKLNGAKNSNPSFYAPLDGGEKGKVLLAQGENNAPKWAEAGTAFYGTCTTGASEQVKEVTCADFGLVKGAVISVRFDEKNTTSAPKLDVNGTGYKSIIFQEGAALAPEKTWRDGSTCTFMYNGTNYVLLSEQVTTESILYDMLHSQTMYDAVYPVGMTMISSSAPVVWEGCTATWTQDTSGRYIAASSPSHAIGTSITSPQSQNIKGYFGGMGQKYNYAYGINFEGSFNGPFYKSGSGTVAPAMNSNWENNKADKAYFDATRQSEGEQASIYKAGLQGDERLRPVTNFYGVWTRTA